MHSVFLKTHTQSARGYTRISCTRFNYTTPFPRETRTWVHVKYPAYENIKLPILPRALARIRSPVVLAVHRLAGRLANQTECARKTAQTFFAVHIHIYIYMCVYTSIYIYIGHVAARFLTVETTHWRENKNKIKPTAISLSYTAGARRYGRITRARPSRFPRSYYWFRSRARARARKKKSKPRGKTIIIIDTTRDY